MGFVVNPKRDVTFHHTIVEKEKEPIEISVSFSFVAAEDIDYVELQKKAEDKTTFEMIDEGTGKKKTINMGLYNTFLYTLRTSLVGCTGFVDPENNEIKIKDEDGKIIVNNQLVVFEAVRMMKELFDKIIIAYSGTQEKNL